MKYTFILALCCLIHSVRAQFVSPTEPMAIHFFHDYCEDDSVSGTRTQFHYIGTGYTLPPTPIYTRTVVQIPGWKPTPHELIDDFHRVYTNRGIIFIDGKGDTVTRCYKFLIQGIPGKIAYCECDNQDTVIANKGALVRMVFYYQERMAVQENKADSLSAIIQTLRKQRKYAHRPTWAN